jgi:hypothetical protein
VTWRLWHGEFPVPFALGGLCHDQTEEIGIAQQDLRDLRPPVRVAEEVGTQLGRGEVLFGPLPEREVKFPRESWRADWREPSVDSFSDCFNGRVFCRYFTDG